MIIDELKENENLTKIFIETNKIISETYFTISLSLKLFMYILYKK